MRRLRERPKDAAARDVILAAAVEVRAPVVYATLMLALVLTPVLLLHGLQGAFFAPLAGAFIVATLASLAVAVLIHSRPWRCCCCPAHACIPSLACWRA